LIHGAILWGESFKDATLGNRAVTALPNQRVQFPPQCREVGQFALHIRKGARGRSRPRLRGIEQIRALLDLADRKEKNQGRGIVGRR
jgi:hypothetical protein